MFGLTLKRKAAAYRMTEVSGAADGTLAQGRRGIVIGTRIATAQGWRDVGGILAGDMVLTFDNGMQPVLEVRRTVLMPSGDAKDWPLAVPGGALGNGEPMMLSPRQMVVVESDMAEAIHGDPFVAVPAMALDGVCGVAPVFPREGIELVTLHFAHEEVVFGGAGALFLCTQGGNIVTDMGFGPAPYVALSLEEAREVVDSIEITIAPGGSPAQMVA